MITQQEADSIADGLEFIADKLHLGEAYLNKQLQSMFGVTLKQVLENYAKTLRGN